MIVTKATRLLKPLLVLGLESSADDTCASVVSSTRKILSSVVLKQGHVHEVYGGIHPLHAQEAHQANMGVAIRRALQEAQVGLSDLDGIAFTRGPGMHGCLGVCAGAAKALAGATGLPLLGVHHMQAHALTPLLTEEVPPEFPFLTLLVSGGHTLLVLARSETSFKILATCDDESIGAAFDKACRDLRIPYSLGNNGSPGSALEAFSSLPSTPLPTVSPGPFSLALRNQLAFSFAGPRSQLTRILSREPVEEMVEERRRELARQFVAAAVGQVEEKVKLALRDWRKSGEPPLMALVASGGVASNAFLRMRLRHCLDTLGHEDMRLVFPPVALCTGESSSLDTQRLQSNLFHCSGLDNAAMIASVGLSRLRRGRIDDLTVMQRSKWSIEECEADFGIESID